MLSLIFYLIIAPAILAFLLGFSAHGLKKMTSSIEDSPSSNSGSVTNSPDSDDVKTQDDVSGVVPT